VEEEMDKMGMAGVGAGDEECVYKRGLKIG
jgi:hypothetical protein